MKRQIRRSVFETNSSSTHAICISKEKLNKDDFPKFVPFTHGEYGWEFAVYGDTWTKASYLYEAIFACYYNNEIEIQNKCSKIAEMLDKYDIHCGFAQTKDTKWGNGYIDHGGETIDFVEAVLEDEQKLLSYLFGDSFVVTGNDNGDSFTDYMYEDNGDYNYSLKPEFSKYEIYEKWN